MDAIRQVIFRPSARTGVMGAALAVGILALTSIQVSAAVIGSASATPGIGCNNLDTVQYAAAGISYSVPAPGQITSWSTLAISNLGPAGLLVWRPTTPVSYTYTLVAATTPVALVLGPNTFNLTTPIDVQTGDVLGIRAQGPIDCGATAAVGNTMAYHVGATPGLGVAQTFLPDPLLMMLNVTATIGPPPTTTPPPGGCDGTGDCQQSGNNGPGAASAPAPTKSTPAPTTSTPAPSHPTTDPSHHKKVKGTPTETHSESQEAIFLF